MGHRLQWDEDGRDWPWREASRFVQAGGLRWHVQQLGAGPVVLLVHGTGAATHSWRGILPLLAQQFTVLAVDLPGHGFSSMPPRWQLSLPGMAGALARLLDTVGLAPAIGVGHSAGAAVLARMCLDRSIDPRLLVSLNGALLPLGGLAGQVFSPLARLFSVGAVVPRLFAWRATDPAVVTRLLDTTGSVLDADGVEYYGRLMRSAGHAEAALGMMANWDLVPLERDLPRLAIPLLQVVGERDLTVRPEQARRVTGLLPAARSIMLPGLGHLAHEENPALVAGIIAEAANGAGFAADGTVPGGAAPQEHGG